MKNLNTPPDTPPFLNMNRNELRKQQEELLKFDQHKSTFSEMQHRFDNRTNREPSPEIEPRPNPQYKIETASLCGLKVEYRPRGMENNSDDDADVVIEEETDYKMEPERIDVSQFLTSPSQSTAKISIPEVFNSERNILFSDCPSKQLLNYLELLPYNIPLHYITA